MCIWEHTDAFKVMELVEVTSEEMSMEKKKGPRIKRAKKIEKMWLVRWKKNRRVWRVRVSRRRKFALLPRAEMSIW